MTGPALRTATADDARACVDILSAWIAETPWMPRLHSDASMLAFWRGRLAAADGWVMAEAGAVLGFCLRDAGFVTALYLHPQARRRSLGKALLDRAKDGCNRLDLWVFAPNTAARAFYAQQGFIEARRTDGDNEERIPDLLLRWTRV